MSASRARRVAFGVLLRVFEEGAFADRAFRAAADRAGLAGRERAQAQRLAYGAVQRRGTADHLIERLAARDPGALDPPVRAALRLGVYELLFSERTPERAAVAEAVELAKTALRGRRGEAAAGLVNAVLRRVAREGRESLAALDERTPEGAAILHSLPAWLVRLWWRELGAEAALSLARAANEPAEVALRVNRLRAEPGRIAAELARAGEPVEPPPGGGLLAPRGALVVRGRMGPALRESIARGELVPQSRGSQAVVEALAPAPGERVLDLCAGPGIKTSAIAARVDPGGRVVAVELRPARARLIRELCARLGATGVEVQVADAAEGGGGDGGYDRVLVDPPCSDLGTLASRPDARWRKSAAAIARLGALQERILARGAEALRPGGTLVYSTCTISRRENEEVVSGVLAAHPEIRADDLGAAEPALASAHDRRFLQIRPDRDRTDGFFIARLRREAA